MKKILLTQGKFALVDNEDFDWLNQWKWYAQHDTNTFYALRGVKKHGIKTHVIMHRLILRAKSGQFVDHRDSDGLNNQRSNLRIATNSENQRNRGKPRNNKSGFKGVSWNRGMNKWQAHICVNRRLRNLGYFNDIEQAARAYDDAAFELHGEFARANEVSAA